MIEVQLSYGRPGLKPQYYIIPQALCDVFTEQQATEHCWIGPKKAKLN